MVCYLTRNSKAMGWSDWSTKIMAENKLFLYWGCFPQCYSIRERERWAPHSMSPLKKWWKSEVSVTEDLGNVMQKRIGSIFPGCVGNWHQMSQKAVMFQWDRVCKGTRPPNANVAELLGPCGSAGGLFQTVLLSLESKSESSSSHASPSVWTGIVFQEYIISVCNTEIVNRKKVAPQAQDEWRSPSS